MSVGNPGYGWVVISIGFKRRVDQFLARGAERFRRGVKIKAVAALVLHFGQQRGLATERGGARDPVAFRQHADDFGMGMLGDLPGQRLAVRRGHPVIGLNAFFGIDPRLKLRGASGVLTAGVFGFRGVERLRVHG